MEAWRGEYEILGATLREIVASDAADPRVGSGFRVRAAPGAGETAGRGHPHRVTGAGAGVQGDEPPSYGRTWTRWPRTRATCATTTPPRTTSWSIRCWCSRVAPWSGAALWSGGAVGRVARRQGSKPRPWRWSIRRGCGRSSPLWSAGAGRAHRRRGLAQRRLLSAALVG